MTKMAIGKCASTLLGMLPRSLQQRMLHRPELIKILDNIGWLFFDKILRLGVGFLVGAQVARHLGPEQFGLWSYATAFTIIFSIFATLGLDNIIVRDLVKYPDRFNTLLGTAFVLKLIGSIFAILISIFSISQLRSGDELALWLVGISALGFIFQSTSVIDFYFQAKVQSRYSVIAANASFSLMTALKIYLLIISAPLISFAWAGLGEIILTAIFIVLAYHTNHLNFHAWRFDRSLMFELLRESWPLFLSGLAVILYMRVDMIMLQEISGDHDVGIYAAATKISEIIYFLPTVIIASVSPAIINSHSKNNEQYIKNMQRLYFCMAWLAIGITLPLSLFSNQITSTLYGKHFQESAIVLAIHLWASVAVFLGMASSQHLLTERLQKISFYRTLIGLISNIGLNIILIPSMGATGAAIATVISYFLATFSIILFKQTRQHTIFLISSIISYRSIKI